MPNKSLERIEKELKQDQIRMHEERAMLRMLNLDKIGDFMLKTGINSFGFVDTVEHAVYFASRTETKDGRQKITVEKTYPPEDEDA